MAKGSLEESKIFSAAPEFSHLLFLPKQQHESQSRVLFTRREQPCPPAPVTQRPQQQVPAPQGRGRLRQPSRRRVPVVIWVLGAVSVTRNGARMSEEGEREPVPFYYPPLYGCRWLPGCTHAGPAAVGITALLCTPDRVLRRHKGKMHLLASAPWRPLPNPSHR